MNAAIAGILIIAVFSAAALTYAWYQEKKRGPYDPYRNRDRRDLGHSVNESPHSYGER